MYKKTIIALFSALISLSALNAIANESNNTQAKQTVATSSTSTKAELSVLDQALVLLGLSGNEEAIKSSCANTNIARCCSRSCGLGKVR